MPQISTRRCLCGIAINVCMHTYHMVVLELAEIVSQNVRSASSFSASA